MAQKERVIFQRSAWTITTIKTKELFNSVFSYGKLRDSSLIYFPVFVVLYLEIVENIDQMQKKYFFLLPVNWDEPDDVINLVTWHK